MATLTPRLFPPPVCKLAFAVLVFVPDPAPLWSPCWAAGTTVTAVTVLTAPFARVVLKTTDCVIELWLSALLDD